MEERVKGRENGEKSLAQEREKRPRIREAWERKRERERVRKKLIKKM